KEGKMSGKGVLYYRNSQVKREGHWKDGKLVSISRLSLFGGYVSFEYENGVPKIFDLVKWFNSFLGT
ncbi:hypothetical protein DID77_03405, partial [Candidatus Marinamargulisbacteria bacterium SCGC AG-439-L15]